MDVYVRRENSHRTPITKMITTIEAPIDRIIECLDTLEIRR